MKMTVYERNNQRIAVVQSDTVLITDEGSALDFAMTVQYETQTSKIALNQQALCEDFFQLRTRIAGGILQKFVNYGIQFAIYGNFSDVTSEALRDFIYESNQGTQLFFSNSLEEALAYLSR